MLPLPIHFFRAVEHPRVTVSARGCLQRHRVRAVVGLGQREGTDLLQARHRRQPVPLLLLGPAVGDRAHGQPRLHPDEGADAAVAAVELHRDQPGRQRVHRRTSVALDTVADQTGGTELLDDRPGELGAVPVLVDLGEYLVVDELPGPGQVLQLVGRELVAEVEVVGVQSVADADLEIVRHVVFSFWTRRCVVAGRPARWTGPRGRSPPPAPDEIATLLGRSPHHGRRPRRRPPRRARMRDADDGGLDDGGIPVEHSRAVALHHRHHRRRVEPGHQCEHRRHCTGSRSVSFLAGEQSAFVSGQVIYAAGGPGCRRASLQRLQ